MDSVLDYKTTNVKLFLRGFEELSMNGFPLAEVVLLWQSVFNFPNRLFHECLIKNQANHNLSFVKRKMQGSR